MTKPLRLLVLEDNALDAEMFIRELRRAGFDPDWKRVEDKADFQAELDTSPDLILADYALPRFNGVRAVQLLRERGLDIPFILISGTIGEEAAVEAMKLGATDYLLKDRIARLGPAVERALEERSARAERRQNEERLRVSEAQYRCLFEAAKDGILIVNAVSGMIEDVNPYLTGLLGLTREDLLHKKVWELGCFKHLISNPQKFVELQHNEYVHYEGLPLETSDDRGVEVEFVSNVYEVNGAKVIQCNIRDITARRRAEKALGAAEHEQRKLAGELKMERARLLEAQAVAKMGSWETKADNLEVTWSAETHRIFESSPDLFQPTHEGFLRFVHPEDRNRVDRAFRESLQNPDPCCIQHRLLLPDGRLKYVEERWQAFHDDDGKPIRAIGTCQDITERKLVEVQLRQFNEELERRVAERTAELEQANQELDAFSHSVSHDLRAPLRTISGFGQFLAEQCASALDERGRGHLRRMMAAAAHMSTLIDDLLQFAHASRSELRRKPVDLSALAQEVVRDLQQSAPERRVQFLCAPGLNVSGDARLLRVVLVNLLSNAWKYTGKAAEPRVEFGRLDGGGETSFFIRDNGAGFDMRYADRLFGAFQRLHSVAEFEGTGVGLATVQRIIHRHGGKIRAEAKVNEGATFYFTLPESPGPQPVELRRAERFPFAAPPFSP